VTGVITLLVGRRRALHIERDAKHPQMWRVRLPDGTGGDLTATGPECLATLARKYLALGHSPDQELDVGRRYGRWTARDLFGLQTPPAKPHPSYSRLSRYDETGLIWLLQGRLVVALTETTAAIQNPMLAVRSSGFRAGSRLRRLGASTYRSPSKRRSRSRPRARNRSRKTATKFLSDGGGGDEALHQVRRI
jgi:hypothetical protein